MASVMGGGFCPEWLRIMVTIWRFWSGDTRHAMTALHLDERAMKSAMSLAALGELSPPSSAAIMLRSALPSTRSASTSAPFYFLLRCAMALLASASCLVTASGVSPSR